jgi:hypothetical protein
VAKNGCPGMVEAQVGRFCLNDIVGCEANVLEGSGPAPARVTDPPVFDVARDYSFGGEGGA